MFNLKIGEFWKRERLSKITSPMKTKFWSLCSEVLISCCFVLFFAQTIFFAFNIKEDLPPDEFYHVKLSQIYSSTLSVPGNSEETYFLGEIAHVPFLYHWLGGRVINIKNAIFPTLEDFLVLRLFSVIIGTLNLFLAYKIIRLITRDRLAYCLFMIMLSNTLMLVFISGSASYDPLSVCFPLLTIYLGLKLFKSHSINFLFFFFISILLGIMTKVTFLPFGLVNILFFLIHELKYRKDYLEQIKKRFNNKKSLLFIIMSLLLTFFFFLIVCDLYVTNLVTYKSIRPDCALVIGKENCMKNIEYKGYYELEKIAPPKEERLNLYWYIPHWINLVLDRTYGIFTSSKMTLSYNAFASYLLCLVSSAILFIRRFDRKQVEHVYFSLIIIVYLLVLMIFTNYEMYLSNGIIHAAVQGRYIFPILVPIYVLASLSLLSMKNKYLRVTIFFIVSGIFLYGNIPFFVKNFTEDWFFENSWATSLIINTREFIYTINHHIRNFLH